MALGDDDEVYEVLQSPISMNEKNSVDLQEKEEDEDAPAWIRALRRWRLYPAVQRTESSSTEKGLPQTVGEFKLPDALVSLVNVEALLMVSSGEVPEGPTSDFGYVGQILSRLSNETDSMAYDSVASETSKSLEANSTGITSSSNAQRGSDLIRSLDELGDLNTVMSTLQKSLVEMGATTGTKATDSIIKEATLKIDAIVSLASNALSPGALEDLILKAGRALTGSENVGNLQETINRIVKSAEALARDRQLNVTETADRARASTKYTADLIRMANGVLVSGYVADESNKRKSVSANLPGIDAYADIDMNIVESSERLSNKPLFHNFWSAHSIPKSDYKQAVIKITEMARLAGAIYEDVVPQTHAIGHSIVANGTTADVSWMVTDNIGYKSEFQTMIGDDSNKNDDAILVRTITIKGFDASDENVDRERLLINLCTANPVSIPGVSGIEVHSGLLSVARDLYKELKPFIELSATSHRVVFNGHSIGGALSVLMLMLFTEEYGAEYVQNKVMRVFTFGAPPISMMSSSSSVERKPRTNSEQSSPVCPVLDALGLSPTLVYEYSQPWDPIPRLFSEIDPLYPLLGDLGPDGKTLYASGPTRTLRPITRAIIESWEGWPRFRDTFRGTANQNYTHVGVQHLILPEPLRYLTDRLVSVNTGVPPIDSVIRISSNEFFPALASTFPLDVFSISFVPTAIRSFVHHFYPAYAVPLVEFTNKKPPKEEKVPGQTKKGISAAAAKMPNGNNNFLPINEARLANGINNAVALKKLGNPIVTSQYNPSYMQAQLKSNNIHVRNDSARSGIDWTEAAANWVLGGGLLESIML
eukprot:CAMPEP_0198281860 /NCGR_PEP_ID=MMETSP1449-20131203/1733_1 /TAXON_ID=420275 /ORGANISM="Attheya septentrionalis, Strain CCMP2084" /LENGTH=820 /DNA_ID=CAMNT_0043977829 /DNA_START=330 /DNA_END=2792 /DNA_ORIENTATION=-